VRAGFVRGREGRAGQRGNRSHVVVLRSCGSRQQEVRLKMDTGAYCRDSNMLDVNLSVVRLGEMWVLKREVIWSEFS
jgi:hypothetical protein